MASSLVVSALLVFLLHAVAVRGDPDPLQDFCVADFAQKIQVNGYTCKDPDRVTPDDFTSMALRQPPNTSNIFAVDATLVDVTVFPALNFQGVSLARLAFGPSGLNPPHVHPRASEVLYLVQGSLYVGFVASSPRDKLFAKVLMPGDLFVFPRGLVHFQRNVGKGPALAISALGSQNPGRFDVAKSLFATTPPIMDEVLQTTFQVGKPDVMKLRDLVGMTPDVEVVKQTRCFYTSLL